MTYYTREQYRQTMLGFAEEAAKRADWWRAFGRWVVVLNAVFAAVFCVLVIYGKWWNLPLVLWHCFLARRGYRSGRTQAQKMLEHRQWVLDKMKTTLDEHDRAEKKWRDEWRGYEE